MFVIGLLFIISAIFILLEKKYAIKIAFVLLILYIIFILFNMIQAIINLNDFMTNAIKINSSQTIENMQNWFSKILIKSIILLILE